MKNFIFKRNGIFTTLKYDNDDCAVQGGDYTPMSDIPTDDSYSVGQKIQCFYDDDYYDGTIVRKNVNGSYFVQFEDGDVLEDAVASEIRLHITSVHKRAEIDILDIPEFALGAENKGSWLRPLGTQDDVEESASNVDDNNQSMKSTHNVNNQNEVPKELNQFEKLLAAVEMFILPSIDERYMIKRNKVTDRGLLPAKRLSHLLTQVAIAEHIRTVQTLYRDSDDELKLVSELRVDNPSAKLTTKSLISKITEGRARICGLCRVKYGEHSVQALRSKVDLANSYALQGMWPQVAEHISMAIKSLAVISMSTKPAEFNAALRRGILNATRVRCVYHVLRDHCSRHSGHVIQTIFLDHLSSSLASIQV